jgi:hypothetical protein
MKARKIEVDAMEYDGLCSKCDSYINEPVIIRIGNGLYESNLCKPCMSKNRIKGINPL